MNFIPIEGLKQRKKEPAHGRQLFEAIGMMKTAVCIALYIEIQPKAFAIELIRMMAAKTGQR